MKLTGRRTQLYLPAELHEQVLHYARAKGVSLAAIVRLSLQETLKRKEWLSKPTYDRDPIWRLLGAAKSKDGDHSTRHDAYLYSRGKPNG